jgi:Arc/MetJ-type ribon-helix-helix transcriptional regulator
MKATTIKLEGELLQELEQAKPARTSVSAFVREVLRKDLRRRKLAEAAVAYEAFVASNAEERTWMREWDEADLAALPRRSRR